MIKNMELGDVKDVHIPLMVEPNGLIKNIDLGDDRDVHVPLNRPDQ